MIIDNYSVQNFTNSVKNALGCLKNGFVFAHNYTKLHIMNVWESKFTKKRQNGYEISYLYNNKWYKVVVRRPRPNCIDMVVGKIDRNGEHHDIDASNEIFEKMGPGYDFHNIPTTPSMLGYLELTFYCGDNLYSFAETDIIDVNKIRM